MAEGKTTKRKGAAEVKEVDMGDVNIADEVLSLLAYKATIDVEGVASMTGGLMTDLAGLVRKGETPKGVRIIKDDEEVTVEVSVEVEYGKDMTEIASGVQTGVAKALKDMAGIDVAAVNVNIAGVHISKPQGLPPEPPPPEGE
jgi:uncharacterized alkaline shock family protein YloU